MFDKPIDRIQTNGIVIVIFYVKELYILEDEDFSPLKNVSTEDFSKEQIYKYLLFPTGILRGVFKELRINCSVVAEISKFPRCILRL